MENEKAKMGHKQTQKEIPTKETKKKQPDVGRTQRLVSREPEGETAGSHL